MNNKKPEFIDPSDVADENHYRGKYRPQFHYTPLQGFTADPTGLIYYRGDYHLFHMFDPWQRERDMHKNWGHAVSPDLIHWTQLPPVLDTLIDNKPGSGSGVVDWNNSSGLRNGKEKTLMIFYTDYKRGSCIAYSNNCGESWTRFKNNPVLPGVNDVRDPYVFWYTYDRKWCMVRYEKGGFAFYSSQNLIDWQLSSRLEGFYECPELLELVVDGNLNNKKWVLIDGNGTYVIGSFDGKEFIPESDRLRVEYGEDLYATQSWKLNHEGDSQRIQIAWLRYPETPKLVWKGQMSFPCQLSLHNCPQGIFLYRKPISQIKNLRTFQYYWQNKILKPEESFIKNVDEKLLDIRLEVELEDGVSFCLIIWGEKIMYSGGTITCFGSKGPLKPLSNRIKLQVLLDRSSIELFGNDGKISISKIFFPHSEENKLIIFSKNGILKINFLEVNILESIW